MKRASAGEYSRAPALRMEGRSHITRQHLRPAGRRHVPRECSESRDELVTGWRAIAARPALAAKRPVSHLAVRAAGAVRRQRRAAQTCPELVEG
jgi:hypothetical protein